VFGALRYTLQSLAGDEERAGKALIAWTRSSSGWTGGQYSLLRLAFALSALAYAAALWLGGEDGSLGQRWVATLMILCLALPLGMGLLDRMAACALAFALLLHRFLSPEPDFFVSWPAFESLLILHAFVPHAPYASFAARARASPAGDWYLPDAIHDMAWLVLGLTHLLSGLAAFGALSSWAEAGVWDQVSIALHLGFLPLALFHRSRILAFVLGMSSLAFGPWDAEIILAFTAHLACFSPAWIPGSSPKKETLFYDGECGLCHIAVRFCLAEDSSGGLWSFAPLGGSTFTARVPEATRSKLPDSIIVLTAEGEILSQSSAVVRCLSRLGGVWRLLALLLFLVPAPLRDAIYKGVAKVRHHLFVRPDSACPLVPESLRSRFLLDEDTL